MAATIPIVTNRSIPSLIEETGEKRFVLESKLVDFVKQESVEHTIFIARRYYHRSFGEHAYDVYLLDKS